MNYYNEIKNKLIDNEVYSNVKDYSKERHKVITYFEIGRLLTEAGGKYGDNVIDEYSQKLVVEVGKKYNGRTLFRMKQLYNIFSNEKVSTLWTQLTWCHLRLLFSLENDSISSNIKLCNAFSVAISILFLFLINMGLGTKSVVSISSSSINLFLVSLGNLSYSLFLIISLNSLLDKFFSYAILI